MKLENGKTSPTKLHLFPLGILLFHLTVDTEDDYIIAGVNCRGPVAAHNGAPHTALFTNSELRGLTLRSLMLYIYGAPILDVSRSHTTTQHSR